jgi:hypothetical protein
MDRSPRTPREATAAALARELLSGATESGRLPAKLAEEIAACFEDALLEHPEGARMLERLLPDPVVDRSEERATVDPEAHREGVLATGTGGDPPDR